MGAPTKSITDAIQEPLLKKAKRASSNIRLSEDDAAKIMMNLGLKSAFNLGSAYFHPRQVLVGDSLNAFALHNAKLDKDDGALEYWFNIPRDKSQLKLKLISKMLENPTIDFKKYNSWAVGHAVVMDNTDLVNKLLGKGCRITEDALINAIFYQKFNMIKYLVENEGFKPSLKSIEAAIQLKYFDIADYLYQNSNQVSEMSVLKRKNWIKSLLNRLKFKVIDYLVVEKGFQVDMDQLNTAASMGIKEIVLYLIEKRGLVPDSQTISLSIYGGHAEMIFLLLDKNIGIYPNILSDLVVNDNLEVLEYVLNNYNIRPDQQLLYLAIGRNSLPIVKYLMEVHLIQPGNSALALAGISGKLPIFLYLIQKAGIKPNVTILNDLAFFGHLNHVRYLVEISKIKISHSTLTNAVDSGELEIVKYLTQILQKDKNRQYSEADAVLDDEILLAAVTSFLDSKFLIVKYLIEEIHILPSFAVFRHVIEDVDMQLFTYLLDHIDLSERKNRYQLLAISVETDCIEAIEILMQEKGFRYDAKLLDHPMFSGLD